MAGLEDLNIYKMACELEKIVYEFTENFPRDEKYRKVDQLKRASSSVCDNIAEGYGKYSFQSKIQSFCIARGEATEAQSQIKRTINKGLISNDYKWVVDKYIELTKGINGYIRFLRTKKEGVNLT